MLIILLIPIAVTVFTLTAISWTGLKYPELVRKSASALLEIGERHTATSIPEEYIPVYKEAAEEYAIPWTLLAAHHRIETRFSTMEYRFYHLLVQKDICRLMSLYFCRLDLSGMRWSWKRRNP